MSKTAVFYEQAASFSAIDFIIYGHDREFVFVLGKSNNYIFVMEK